MNSLRISLLVVATVLFIGRTTAFGQSTRDELFKRLPYANQQILLQLAKTRLTKDWNKPTTPLGTEPTKPPIERDSTKRFQTVFASAADKRAWETLESHFMFGKPTQEWTHYWHEIPYAPTTFPTSAIGSSGGTTERLLKLPDPELPSGATEFDHTHPAPLPGDVVLFGAKGAVVGGVWWGNRRFPHWETLEPVSFFYYTYQPYIDTDIWVFTGISYNTYPPRITPILYRALYPNTTAAKLKANAHIFERAAGYLGAGRKNAYAKFYMPTGLDDWASNYTGFIVLRRRSANTLADEIVRIANVEYRRWNSPSGKWKETEDRAIPTLQDYWKTGVHQTISRDNLKSIEFQKNKFWSAAFISWVMRKASAGPYFRYNPKHAVYIIAAKSNHAKGFRAYRISEAKPEPGDLVCKDREKDFDVTFDNIKEWMGTHTDIVTEVKPTYIVTIGGNVGDSVSKTIVSTANGYVSKAGYFAVIKYEEP